MIESHQVIVTGDDYKAIDGRALTWYSPTWPNLAGATPEMIVGHDSATVFGTGVATWKGTALPSTPSPLYTATLELTHTQTKELVEGAYDYILRATLTDGSIVTLAFGTLTVQQEPVLTPPNP